MSFITRCMIVLTLIGGVGVSILSTGAHAPAQAALVVPVVDMRSAPKPETSERFLNSTFSVISQR